jgi:competence protein ComEC
VRRVVELHWPALLVGAACAGLVASNWVTLTAAATVPLALVSLVGVALASPPARVLALGVALVAIGLHWGALRLDALERSALTAEIGESGSAQLVVTAPARHTRFAVRVAAQTRSFRGRPLRERVLLVLPVGRSPPRGAILEAVVRVVEPRAPSDGFDERGWLARQGIHVVLRADAWREVGRRGGIAGGGDRLRDRIEASVGRGTSGTRRALVLGVVLGEDEGLSDGVRNAFRAAGLSHLLAVSGQNVAFLVIGVFGLGWLLRLSKTVCQVAALGVISAYVFAVGWQPSVVRAGVAGALASLAWLLARPSDRWHFLALGALVLLLWSPTAILEPGFQLTFAAVAGIFLGVHRVRDRLAGYPVPRGLAEVIGLSLVCGLATAPIVLVHFGQAPVYTVLANALATPAVPCVLGLGLLSAAVSPVSPEAATAFAWLAGWAAAWLELVARVVGSLPGAEVGVEAALLAGGLACAGYVAARLPGGGVRVGAASIAAVAVGGLCLVVAFDSWAVRSGEAWSSPAGLRVTFLDVGQGDAVLLETASARVLVDQGPPEADVAGQLLRLGVRSLSALVLTHPELDHVGGAASVLRRLAVGTVLDPGLAATGPAREEAIAAARERGVPVREARAGLVLRAGGLVLRVLWPPDAGLAGEDPNTNAVVLVASYGETDVYLPADAESGVTARLRVRDVEVLKVAHHGSEDPGLEQALRTLRPRIAVVSAGRGNEYGHPRPETLSALQAVPGLSLFRTDADGRVVVESDGRVLRVRAG